MFANATSKAPAPVALLTEGVDRNIKTLLPAPVWPVALLAEGVDRNDVLHVGRIHGGLVALLAEGVDRNVLVPLIRMNRSLSPSSRRAWIEIDGQCP